MVTKSSDFEESIFYWHFGLMKRKILLITTFLLIKFSKESVFAQELRPLGGHENQLIMTKEWVYKEVNPLELAFYQHLQDLGENMPFRDLFVKTHNPIVMNKNAKEYIVMDNIISKFHLPIIMDIKLGQFTTSKQILKLRGQSTMDQRLKQLRHWVADTANGTRSRGYFLVKAHVPDKYLTNNLKQLLIKKNHAMATDIILPKVFSLRVSIGTKEEIRACYRAKLQRLEDFLEQQLESKLDSLIEYKFIGTSILMAHDLNYPATCDLKFIDFANTMISTSERPIFLVHQKKHIKGMLIGVRNLMKLL